MGESSCRFDTSQLPAIGCASIQKLKARIPGPGLVDEEQIGNAAIDVQDGGRHGRRPENGPASGSSSGDSNTTAQALRKLQTKRHVCPSGCSAPEEAVDTRRWVNDSKADLWPLGAWVLGFFHNASRTSIQG